MASERISQRAQLCFRETVVSHLKQAMKEKLQCTSKYGHLRISQDICHVRMTDIEGFLTIYGHSDNLLNNNVYYSFYRRRAN